MNTSMTETDLHYITTQKGKFVDPSSSWVMDKYAFDQHMINLSPTTTKAIEMGSDLPACINVASSSKQFVSQSPEIELPGDIGSELALPYYTNVEWPKPKFKVPIIDLDDDDDDDRSIEDAKRRKVLGSAMPSSSRGGQEMMHRLIGRSNVEAYIPSSCFWLRRLLHGGSKGGKKPEDAVPSIAAMAMLGRALSAPPCERVKKGAVTVWNT